MSVHAVIGAWLAFCAIDAAILGSGRKFLLFAVCATLSFVLAFAA